MQRKRSSLTAQGIAALRAVESSRPPEQRICYDPLARRLVSPIVYLLVKLLAGYGEWRAPGTTGFLAARTRHIDDTLQACLAGGIDQLVILGAGLDSRAYRFEGLRERVQVFEVDHPATQQTKREKLGRILGRLPDHVTFVPADLDRENLAVLPDLGYDKGRKTLFIWEGVTYYLTAEAVDRTLAFVARNSGEGSSIIFDYVHLSALTAAHKRGEISRMQRYGRFTGEQMTFGIKAGEIEEFLSRRGYTQIEHVTAEDLKRAYLTGANQSRPIAPIYAIVHATVRSG